MQLAQQTIKQLFVSDTDSLEVEYSPYFDGVMVTLDMEDFHYYVPFKEFSISEALSSNGVLLRAFEHMLHHPERCIRQIQDIKQRFEKMTKSYEFYQLEYYPVTINNTRGRFTIQADCSYVASVFLETVNDKVLVSQGTIEASSYLDFVENCNTYCTGLAELENIVSA